MTDKKQTPTERLDKASRMFEFTTEARLIATELEQWQRVLNNPQALWVNILRGTVPKPAGITELERQLDQCQRERNQLQETVTYLRERLQSL